MNRIAIFSNNDLSTKYRAKGNEWNFHEDDTNIHLHALHPYPAKFIPQIPRKAILEWTQEGDTVLDPFCGCGTTLLECSLLNRNSIGIDNNAVAVLTSDAKVRQYSQKDLSFLKKFKSKINTALIQKKDNLWIPEYKSLDYWFDRECIKELSIIKYEINKTEEPVKVLLLAILSSIIVRVSYQDSDTRYARIPRSYKSGEATQAFLKKLCDTTLRLEEIIDQPKAKSEVHLADSRKLDFIADDSIDLIVTSPPYLNAYDYHKYHRHRLHWIDGNIEMARDKEIGKHDTFTRKGAKPDAYFIDMEACFKHWQRILRKGGKAFIIIGDAIVSGKPVMVGDVFIEIFNSLGLHLVDHWIRKLLNTKRSFNVRNGRIDEEHLLLVEKSIND